MSFEWWIMASALGLALAGILTLITCMCQTGTGPTAGTHFDPNKSYQKWVGFALLAMAAVLVFGKNQLLELRGVVPEKQQVSQSAPPPAPAAAPAPTQRPAPQVVSNQVEPASPSTPTVGSEEVERSAWILIIGIIILLIGAGLGVWRYNAILAPRPVRRSWLPVTIIGTIAIVAWFAWPYIAIARDTKVQADAREEVAQNVAKAVEGEEKGLVCQTLSISGIDKDTSGSINFAPKSVVNNVVTSAPITINHHYAAGVGTVAGFKIPYISTLAVVGIIAILALIIIGLLNTFRYMMRHHEHDAEAIVNDRRKIGILIHVLGVVALVLLASQSVYPEATDGWLVRFGNHLTIGYGELALLGAVAVIIAAVLAHPVFLFDAIGYLLVLSFFWSLSPFHKMTVPVLEISLAKILLAAGVTTLVLRFVFLLWSALSPGVRWFVISLGIALATYFAGLWYMEYAGIERRDAWFWAVLLGWTGAALLAAFIRGYNGTMDWTRFFAAIGLMIVLGVVYTHSKKFSPAPIREHRSGESRMWVDVPGRKVLHSPGYSQNSIARVKLISVDELSPEHPQFTVASQIIEEHRKSQEGNNAWDKSWAWWDAKQARWAKERREELAHKRKLERLRAEAMIAKPLPTCTEDEDKVVIAVKVNDYSSSSKEWDYVQRYDPPESVDLLPEEGKVAVRVNDGPVHFKIPGVKSHIPWNRGDDIRMVSCTGQPIPVKCVEPQPKSRRDKVKVALHVNN